MPRNVVRRGIVAGQPEPILAPMPQGQKPRGRTSRPEIEDPDRAFVIRLVRNGFGVLMLLAGIVGLVLPILQGWLMILIGLSLIDLPIKHRAHTALLRYGWYRYLALKHDAAWAKWHAYKKKRQKKQKDATSQRR